MACSRLVPMLLCALLPLQGLAQVSPPPLISAPSATEEAPPDSQATPSGEEDAPQGELIPHKWTPQGRRSDRARTVLQVVAGTLLGAAGTLPGLLLIDDSVDCDDSGCGINTGMFFGGLGMSISGMILATTFGIAGVGGLMEDEGHLLATLAGTALGTLAGLGLGFLAILTYAPLAIIALAGPVIGGLIGYQHAYDAPRASRWSGSTGAVWMPVVGVSPSGGIIAGLAGGF
jgi:hypothetical protein